MTEETDLLRAILQVNARQAFKPEVLTTLVSPQSKPNIIRAYNLCDGTRTQAQIAAEAKLDPGNFSKTANRWMELGVCFRIGEGTDARLLHLYPLNVTPKA